jgi:3-deoxy-manno-octulosonate cytidylyltransferase (CMP-KDO synthetase)
MSALAIIPARIGSTRFPRKILQPLGGRPVIAWVVERARRARRLDAVIVATDDAEIASAARAAGAEAVFTRPDHPSGTDRVAEALGDRPARAVINVQGDEPFLDPDLIDRLVGALLDGPAWDMVTACVPITDPAEVRNPAVVKVVRAADQGALYFSRSVIPHLRDEPVEAGVAAGLFWRHLGVYGYQPAFLRRLVAAPPAALEQAEKLEQLRALHLGGRIQVLTAAPAGPGIDTPEDLARAERHLAAEIAAGGR